LDLSTLNRRAEGEGEVSGREGDKDSVTHAVYLRGSIIHAYAHIEYLLADICLQAWKTSQYAHLATPFPYKTDSRIKAVRLLFDSDGPLKSYRDDLRPVLDDLLNFEEMRHFVAHGVMVVKATGPAGIPLEFRLFRTTKKGPEIGAIDMTSAELEDVGVKISSLLHQMLTTFHRIYSDLGFEMER
jgi:hypothetical protein